MQNQKIRTENQNSNGKHEKKTERSGEKIEEEERRQMNADYTPGVHRFCSTLQGEYASKKNCLVKNY